MSQLQKCQEQGLNLYQWFTGLTKVFDTVNWEDSVEAWLSLKYLKAWICVGGKLLDPISAEDGVKQGDLLALKKALKKSIVKKIKKMYFFDRHYYGLIKGVWK